MIKHYQTRDPQSKLVSKEVQGHVDRRDLVLNKAYMLKGNSLKYMQLKKKRSIEWTSVWGRLSLSSWEISTTEHPSKAAVQMHIVCSHEREQEELEICLLSHWDHIAK